MTARLLCRTGEFAGITREVGAATTLGRGSGNDVVVPSPLVSTSHARIVREDDGYVLEDLGSSNGTRLDGMDVRGRVRLESLHVITLAESIDLIFSHDQTAALEERERAPEPAPEPEPLPQLAVALPGRPLMSFTLKEGDNVIGRAASSDIRIDDPDHQVSRSHAVLRVSSDAITLVDSGSANGTFVDGERIETAVLAAGRSFRLGPHLECTLILR